jgi:hypothetical protein
MFGNCIPELFSEELTMFGNKIKKVFLVAKMTIKDI